MLAVAILAAAPVPVALAADCAAEASAAAVVAGVADGDTLRLEDGRLVRLAGIEAPALPLNQPLGTPWPLAAAATAALDRLTAGAAVTLVTGPGAAADRYGRLHAAVTLPDGRDVAAVLVGAGLARVRWAPGEAACALPLLALEKAARAAKKGLWANPAYAVRQAGDSSLLTRTGLYELVEGRPRSVGTGFRMTFIDFGQSYWRDFTIMVPQAVAKAMVDAGTPASGMVGRRVRVRGVIEAAGGPAIRLLDPAQIEFIAAGDGDDDASADR